MRSPWAFRFCHKYAWKQLVEVGSPLLWFHMVNETIRCQVFQIGFVPICKRFIKDPMPPCVFVALLLLECRQSVSTLTGYIQPWCTFERKYIIIVPTWDCILQKWPKPGSMQVIIALFQFPLSGIHWCVNWCYPCITIYFVTHFDIPIDNLSWKTSWHLKDLLWWYSKSQISKR